MTISLIGLMPSSGGGEAPNYNEAKAFPSYITGNNYISDVDATFVANQILADRLQFQPLVPRASHTFVGISFYNTSAAESGNKLRLGIYSSSTAMEPETLVLDAGEITLGAAAGFNTIVISQALVANTLYWLAVVADTATTTYAYDNAYNTPGRVALGFTDTQMTALVSVPYMTHAYAALPATVTGLAYSGIYNPVISLEA